MSRLGRRVLATGVLVGALVLASASTPAFAAAAGAHQHGPGRFGALAGMLDTDGSNAGSTTTTTTTSLPPTPVAWPPPLVTDNVVPAIPADVSVADAATWLGDALTLRDSVLGDLKQRVDGAKVVTDSVARALDGLLVADRSGIDALDASLPGTNDIPDLQADVSAMVTGYRVFALVVPTVRAVLQVETQLATAAQLEGLENALAASVAAEQSQRLANQLQNLASDYARLLDKAVGGDQALLASLLAISPASYDAGLATLNSVRPTLVTNSQQLAGAQSDLQSFLDVLAGSGGSDSVRIRLSVLRLPR